MDGACGIAQLVKNPPAVQETLVQFLGGEDCLEKGKATHSSILPWRIPQTVQSMESQRVGHDSDCHLHFSTYSILSYLLLLCPSKSPVPTAHLSPHSSAKAPW